MKREKLMVAAQYDPALMQKLLAENSAEPIAAAIARIEWGDQVLAEEVQDLLERSVPRPRLGNTCMLTSLSRL
jgi:hypothetical protein